MPTITYVQHDGKKQSVEAELGTSVMLAAVENDVPGIEGECGGCMSCATCHVYILQPFSDHLPPATADELDVLRDVAAELKPSSRLACQLIVDARLDGLVVHVPDTQI